jgi:hypothetical protein
MTFILNAMPPELFGKKFRLISKLAKQDNMFIASISETAIRDKDGEIEMIPVYLDRYTCSHIPNIKTKIILRRKTCSEKLI